MGPVRPDSPLKLYCPLTDTYWQYSCLEEAMEHLRWSFDYHGRPRMRHGRASAARRYEPATCPPPDRALAEDVRVWMDEARIMPPDEWFKVHIEGDFKDEVKAAPEPKGDDDTPF